MDPVSLSKADRFFPLIADCPDNSGGSISLQNILDLKDSGMLDTLRSLQKKILQIRAQSQLFDDTLLQEPLMNTFFRFVDAAYEVVQAKRVKDSGHFLTITRQDNSNISLDPDAFYLNELKACLQHIQERYGRFELTEIVHDENSGVVQGSVERVIAMVKWLLLKNHAIDYLMGFEVSRIPNSNDFMVKVPKWDGSRPIPEAERRERLSEVEGFLIACCQPGRLGVFPASSVKIHHEQ
jgi:hypothetical protein